MKLTIEVTPLGRKVFSFLRANPLIFIAVGLLLGIFGLKLTGLLFSFLWAHKIAVIVGLFLVGIFRWTKTKFDWTFKVSLKDLKEVVTEAKSLLKKARSFLITLITNKHPEILFVVGLFAVFAIIFLLVFASPPLKPTNHTASTKVTQTLIAQSERVVVSEVKYEGAITKVTFNTGKTWIVGLVRTVNVGDGGWIQVWSKNGDAGHRALIIEGWPTPIYLLNEE